MQNFTPSGATVAEVSVTGQRKTAELSTLPHYYVWWLKKMVFRWGRCNNDAQIQMCHTMKGHQHVREIKDFWAFALPMVEITADELFVKARL